MAKPLDYYAGYPSQQATPRWVGITLGSLFGGLTIVSLAIGIRLVLPARTAEASMAPKPEAAQPVVAAAAPVAPATEEPHVAPPSSLGKHARHHGKRGKVAFMSAKSAKRSAPAHDNPRFKKAQMYAKSVSSSNRRDKRARDEIDRLLGL